MKTQSTKKADVVRAWHLFDAEGKTLGRLATQIAQLLLGKHKPTFTTHIDTGDYVVVINSDKIVLTGNKLLSKEYHRHSGYPGGYRSINAGDQLKRDSRKVIEHAVNGMIGKNKLQDPRMRRLKVYTGATHPHDSQFTKETK